MSSPYLLTATCTRACAYSNFASTQAARSRPPACLVTKRFLNHFAPSFCNILQQIKHPLLGMFSICFMLILIKESETEQTVPSRWPYKCEISKLFYLPQTLLVNFFKLIPASESLLIPRRRLSNPSPQIFAFVTAPGANDCGVHLCSTLIHFVTETHLSGTLLAKRICPQQGSWAHTSRAPRPGWSGAQVRARSPVSLEHCHLPATHSRCQCSHLSLAQLTKAQLFPGKNTPGGPGQALLSSPWYSPERKGTPAKMTSPSPSKDVSKRVSPPALAEAYISTGFLETSLCITKALEFFLLWDPKIPHVGRCPKENNH